MVTLEKYGRCTHRIKTFVTPPVFSDFVDPSSELLVSMALEHRSIGFQGPPPRRNGAAQGGRPVAG